MSISCALYDQLEIAAMRKQKVRIVLEGSNAESTVYTGHIKDLCCVDGQEFFVSSKNEKWPLETIVSIENIESPD
ncbi:Rho-binding antiterminator [Thiomicrorhabdus chilensis]|uniref:Rho-binding antiterminator n=1 Tax=Thiomicrorhabdus chilensis TaxID=63656 RepID=UPI0004049168|nr:Rho-binding antiterminator [Thiomicrorhabdus chilensis]